MKLTDKMKIDLKTAYNRYIKDSIKWGGLRTGWALERRNLVKMADMQFATWTMWVITDEGIKYVEENLN